MKLFVPGRICLFGEHSDWAGGYRRINANIEPGRAVITGTNQGLYAEVRAHPSRLIIHSAMGNGDRREPFSVEMERQALLEVASGGGFYSYAAGVAYQMLTHYRVSGLEIDNYRTDLPIGKGLSSSAAICVLAARGFNRLYDLKLTTRGEMEMAYAGEITTPSRCGRLDQGCAYGNRPILMTFDGYQFLDIHMLIVDLKASKDTLAILRDLNRCYPFPEGKLQETVHEYLGKRNRQLVEAGCDAITKGDPKRLGELMTETQREFDRCLAPACPSQLEAPVLHKLLGHKSLKPHIFGGKGVGSQGDGSAQLVVRDEAAGEKAAKIIWDELSMSCLKLTLKARQGVRKAVIPAAGYGTRLFPASMAAKKELFPVISGDGWAKPAIIAIAEEALSAGIEEIAVMVQAADVDHFREVFCIPPSAAYRRKLSKEARDYSEYLLEIGHRITFLPQETQEGFGHAVYCAAEWVGDEPFLLLLGDHLYASDREESCAGQLLEAWKRVGHSVVGLQPTPIEDVHNFGTVCGRFESDTVSEESLLTITRFCEKPTRKYARENLRVEGIPDDTFLTVFGQYILSPGIFAILEEHISSNHRENGEFQLTSCLEELRLAEGFSGVIIRGRRFDIGSPEDYLNSLQSFHRATKR